MDINPQIVNAVVVVAYLVGMVLLGLYLAKFVRRDEDFFLAGRALNKWLVAGTIMATNVAAIYLVGPAGAAYGGGGVAVLLIAWTGNMIAAASALLFVPRLRRLQITTVSEFLEERYGLWVRLLPAALWIVYYALFSGNAIYTLSVALQPITVLEAGSEGLSVNTIIVIVGGAVILYCAFSGLVAVAYTSVIQAFLIIIGGLILLPLSLKAVGGVSALVAELQPEQLVFWKSSGTGVPWPDYRVVIMFVLLGLPYWCTSQYMLQRSFAGRTVRDASKGLILAALITGPLTLAYIVPGICGSLIYTDDQALAKADLVLPRLLIDILPLGLGGLFVAGLMAASNSTASALLNSLATLGEHDFYRRFIPGKSSRHYVWVGRVVTLVAGAVGLIFAFNVEKLGGIIEANFALMSFFEPPIFVIVAAALFWRYVNAWGAALALVIGVAFNAVGALGANYGWRVAMAPEDRTIWALPICFVALFIGSALSRALRPADPERQAKIDELIARTRSVPTAAAVSPLRLGFAWLGVVVALTALVGFVACAFVEGDLPKPPANVLIFGGLMMAFVYGCYLAVPLFVPEEPEPIEAAAAGTIERSWVHRVFGNGWSWLALYVLAAVLVLVLYFV